jgi:hypothetical protein
MSNLRDLLKRIRQWDALDIPDTDGAFWKRQIDAALEQQERPLCKGIPRRGCNYLNPCDTPCNKCGEIHHHHQMVAHFEAAQQPEQENPTRQMPEWMDYDQATDVLTIHGRRYSAAMFGERGFLSPAGTLLQVAEGQPDCVTLMTAPPTEQQEQEQAEPVAWRYDQATYMPGDVRGRQWKFNVFAQHKPYMNNMVQNVTPLYTSPTTTTEPEPK